jgi:D-inositol-3-phosphate glycosyltransferase
MNPLLFYGSVQDVQRDGTNNELSRMDGFTVFQSSLWRAILDHGSWDPIYVLTDYPNTLGVTQPVLIPAIHKHRVRLIRGEDLHTLYSVKRLAVISPGPDLTSLAWLRHRVLAPSVPLIAVMHSLAPPIMCRWFSSRFLDLLGHHDALLCSSTPLLVAIQRTFDVLAPSLSGSTSLPFRLKMIPIGVDLSSFDTLCRPSARAALSLGDRDVVLLYYGRLSRSYKSDLLPLLLVMARLAGEYSSVRLIIAGASGRGGYVEQLRSHVQELNLTDRVSILENTSEVIKLQLFAAADVFVSPSDNVQESFGITILEAMAAALPVVATDWSGYREIVDNRTTGYLVPSYLPQPTHTSDVYSSPTGHTREEVLAASTSFDVCEMHACLSHLIKHGDIRIAMGRAGRRRVAQLYNWNLIITQYQGLCDELVALGIKRTAGAGYPAPTYHDIFKGYPSHTICDSDILCSETQGFAMDTILELAFRHSHIPLGNGQLLLSAVREGGSIEIGTLAQQVHQMGLSEPAVREGIGRLLKYGLIRLVHGTATDSKWLDRGGH